MTRSRRHSSADQMPELVKFITGEGFAVRAIGTPPLTAPAGRGQWWMLGLATDSLCEVCVWTYRYPPLRNSSHVVSRAPAALRAVSGPDLRRVLSAPLASDIAVIVPLTPGRKHLFPVARWGQITVDDGHLTWGPLDAQWLSVMCALRGLGFQEDELRMRVPTFRTLQGLPPNYLASVTEDWKRLESWRAAPPWFEVGARASRPGPG